MSRSLVMGFFFFFIGFVTVCFAMVADRGRSEEPLPKHFIVRGERWRIVLVDRIVDEPEEDAQTDCSGRLVHVRKDIHGRQLAEAVMHEVLHALACNDGTPHDEYWNNSNDDDDECDGHCGIYWGSNELLDWMKSNPEIVRFLIESAK